MRSLRREKKKKPQERAERKDLSSFVSTADNIQNASDWSELRTAITEGMKDLPAAERKEPRVEAQVAVNYDAFVNAATTEGAQVTDRRTLLRAIRTLERVQAQTRADEICDAIEHYLDDHDAAAAYHMVKRLNAKARPRADIAGDTTAAKLKSISSFVHTSLNNPLGDKDVTFPPKAEAAALVYNVEPITADEVRAAQRLVPTQRAEGPDTIPNEVLKMPDLTEPLARAFNVWFRSGDIESDVKTTLMAMLPKPGKKHTEAAGWRYIALMNGCLKLYNVVLRQRLVSIMDPHLRSNQNGFRARRCTAHHTMALNIVMDRAKQYSDSPLVAVMVDYSNAFPSVSWSSIRAALKRWSVPAVLTEAIMSVYAQHATVVRTPYGETDRIAVSAGVLQGDTLAPFLFVLVLDAILEKHVAPLQHLGITIAHEKRSHNADRAAPAKFLADLDFADDIILFAPNFDNAQTLLTALYEGSINDAGLVANPSKTEYFTIGLPLPAPTLKIGKTAIPFVHGAKYLGVFTNVRTALRTRKGQFFARLKELSSIWRNDIISRTTKRRLFRSLVEPILLYGAIAIPMTITDEDRLNGAYTRALRIAMNISYTEHSTLEDLYEPQCTKDIAIPQATTMVTHHQLFMLLKVLHGPSQPLQDLLLAAEHRSTRRTTANSTTSAPRTTVLSTILRRTSDRTPRDMLRMGDDLVEINDFVDTHTQNAETTAYNRRDDKRTLRHRREVIIATQQRMIDDFVQWTKTSTTQRRVQKKVAKVVAEKEQGWKKKAWETFWAHVANHKDTKAAASVTYYSTLKQVASAAAHDDDEAASDTDDESSTTKRRRTEPLVVRLHKQPPTTTTATTTAQSTTTGLPQPTDVNVSTEKKKEKTKKQASKKRPFKRMTLKHLTGRKPEIEKKALLKRVRHHCATNKSADDTATEATTSTTVQHSTETTNNGEVAPLAKKPTIMTRKQRLAAGCSFDFITLSRSSPKRREVKKPARSSPPTTAASMTEQSSPTPPSTTSSTTDSSSNTSASNSAPPQQQPDTAPTSAEVVEEQEAEVRATCNPPESSKTQRKQARQQFSEEQQEEQLRFAPRSGSARLITTKQPSGEPPDNESTQQQESSATSAAATQTDTADETPVEQSNTSSSAPTQQQPNAAPTRAEVADAPVCAEQEAQEPCDPPTSTNAERKQEHQESAEEEPQEALQAARSATSKQPSGEPPDEPTPRKSAASSAAPTTTDTAAAPQVEPDERRPPRGKQARTRTLQNQREELQRRAPASDHPPVTGICTRSQRRKMGADDQEYTSLESVLRRKVQKEPRQTTIAIDPPSTARTAQAVPRKPTKPTIPPTTPTQTKTPTAMSPTPTTATSTPASATTPPKTAASAATSTQAPTTPTQTTPAFELPA